MDKFLIFFGDVTGFDCGGEPVLKIIKFVMDLLDVVLFMVPILLIVMLFVDFLKNVIANQESDMQKNLKIVIKRVLMAMALFLVDPIVHFSFTLLENNDVDFASCIKIATTEDLSLYKIEISDDDYEPVDTDLSKPSGLKPSTGDSSSNSSSNASDVIEKSTSWMEKIAKDNDNGYCNNGKLNDMYGGKGYNCIGLVAMGWDYAGVEGLGKKLRFTNLTKKLTNAGFKDITSSINLKTGANLERGDILARTFKKDGHYHIAQYVGNGKLVEATGDYDNKIGDSSGNEIAINKYYNNDWNHVYRYYGNSSNSDSSSDSSNTTSGSAIIFVGDSRFVGMQTAVGDKSDEYWIAETSMGYNWLKSTAYNKIIDIVKKDTSKKYDIVINLGVNDLGNVSSYKTLYKSMSNDKNLTNSNIYIVSVNPIKDANAKKTGYSVKNSQVVEFNNNMKDIDGYKNIKYCDTYTSIKDSFSSVDGVHYLNNTYKTIYNLIKKCL